MAMLGYPLYGFSFSATDSENKAVSRTVNGVNFDANASTTDKGTLIQNFVQRMLLASGLTYGSSTYIERRQVA